MRLSLKLSALCATAAALPLTVASVAVLREAPSRGHGYPPEQLKGEARAAAILYDKRLEQMRLAAQHLGNEIALKVVGTGEGDPGRRLSLLQDLLSQAGADLSLDFLVVTDNTGRVIARHNDLPSEGETVMQNPLAARIVSDGARLHTSPLAACEVERGLQLQRLWLDKLARVDLPDGTAIEEALVIEAAAPIFRSRGFEGVILIGQMLNNYNVARPGASGLQVPLVTEVRQFLFPGGSAEAGAVIALGDRIVASALRGPTPAGPPLLGARRDAQKSDEVIESGGRSYRVSWQPITSTDGSSVGSLGVAVPVSAPAWSGVPAPRLILIIAVIAVLSAAVIGFLVGRAIAARVNSLTDAVSRMSVGELSTTVRDGSGLNGSSGSLRRDEITTLAEQLDRMRESFRQAIDRIRKR